MNELLTVREAANYLRVSARTVYRLIAAGEIHALLVGKQWRVPAAELRALAVKPEAP